MTDRELIEELQEEVRQLRALLDERLSHQWPEEWGLTRSEARLLSLIATAPGEFASKAYIYEGLYRDASNPPIDNVLSVFMAKIRRKLPPEHAARLVTVWGQGWRWERAVKASAGGGA